MTWEDQGRLQGRGGMWDEKALGMGMWIPSQEKQKQNQGVPVAWRQSGVEWAKSGVWVGW